LPGSAVVAGDPEDVLFLSAEDGMGDTLVPRLTVAGADLRRIHFPDLRDPGASPAVLPRQVPELEAQVEESGAGLVVIDPLMAHLAAGTNAHRDQDVRLALSPLASMATRTGVVVLIVRHLNKATGGPAIYRGGGSIGITGAARSVLLAAKDPDEEGAFVLASIKNNLGPPPAAIGYRIAGRDGAALIEWGEESRHTAETLLAVPDPERNSRLREAEQFLLQTLADGLEHEQPEVEEEAQAQGIKKRTLERARAQLGSAGKVISRKTGMNGGWVWSLASPKAAMPETWRSSSSQIEDPQRNPVNSGRNPSESEERHPEGRQEPLAVFPAGIGQDGRCQP
jgi:hypothetical protein